MPVPVMQHSAVHSSTGAMQAQYNIILLASYCCAAPVVYFSGLLHILFIGPFPTSQVFYVLHIFLFL